MSGLELEVIGPNGIMLGTEETSAIHEKGLPHRAVHVLVFNSQGEIFVRQRPKNKKVYPGKWTSSVGAHILPGQTPEEAATENLKSYLGISNVKLISMANRHIKDRFENEDVSFYRCDVDIVPALNPEQSEEGKFMTIEDVEDLIASEEATPHLKGAIANYKYFIGKS